MLNRGKGSSGTTGVVLFYHRLGKQAAIFLFITMSFGGVGGVGAAELHCMRKMSSGRFSSPQGAYFSLPRRKKLQNMTAHISSICGLSLGLSCLTVPELRRDLVSCEDRLQPSSTCSICSPIDESDFIFKTCDTNKHFLLLLLKSITHCASTHQRGCGKPETSHLLCCVQGQF